MGQFFFTRHLNTFCICNHWRGKCFSTYKKFRTRNDGFSAPWWFYPPPKAPTSTSRQGCHLSVLIRNFIFDWLNDPSYWVGKYGNGGHSTKLSLDTKVFLETTKLSVNNMFGDPNPDLLTGKQWRELVKEKYYNRPVFKMINPLVLLERWKIRELVAWARDYWPTRDLTSLVTRYNYCEALYNCAEGRAMYFWTDYPEFFLDDITPTWNPMYDNQDHIQISWKIRDMGARGEQLTSEWKRWSRLDPNDW